MAPLSVDDDCLEDWISLLDVWPFFGAVLTIFVDVLALFILFLNIAFFFGKNGKIEDQWDLAALLVSFIGNLILLLAVIAIIHYDLAHRVRLIFVISVLELLMVEIVMYATEDSLNPLYHCFHQ